MVLDYRHMGICSVNNVYNFAITNIVTLQNFEIIPITLKHCGTCTYA